MRDSLLFRLLCSFSEIDKYIIVGGYEFDTLRQALESENCFAEFRNRIVLIENEKYKEYGSGYSLYKGLETACRLDFHEIIFAEGDLFLDRQSCERISQAKSNVLTINKDPILADKAVVLYLDTDGRVHYIYDIHHGMLEIKEPFIALYNSGQVWKFSDAKRTRDVFEQIPEEDWQGTNLIFIEEYFRSLNPYDYEIVEFKKWMNCNTIEDYQQINKMEGTDENNK